MTATKTGADKRRLNDKRRKFCELYVGDPVLRGDGAGCYDAAYPSPSRNRNRDTAYKAAKKTLRIPEVLAYLDELRAPAKIIAQCSLEDHLTKLADLCDGAVGMGDYAAAIKAEELRGKASGHYAGKGDAAGAGLNLALGVFNLPDKLEDQVLWGAMVKVQQKQMAAIEHRNGNGSEPGK